MAACDISPDTSALAARNVLWRPFTQAEAFRATCQISSSSPGEDEITAHALRIAWSSLENRFTHPFNNCTFYHMIKDSLALDKIAGIVTVNVKGAFDGVLRNRLLYRMRIQGWPANLIKWVNSFLLDRTAKIRLDELISDTFQILSGLRQSFPTSPILFFLYMEPVLGLSRGRFGYANDILTLETARTLEECDQKLQASLNLTLQ
ncbi:hypothetical protein EPUL_004058 [Erysiphe pulchra]|uniref:Uncharacterized protein n=1 Tax=Erysiphe pulchra TaxID=225359 RepID=A0A2S4PKM3_9PEZI|nr:hypothetical protein EPUL_004058 [Erysiphe pulchra]